MSIRGARVTAVASSTARQSTLEELRLAMGELFGAERRLRGREQRGRDQHSRDLTHSQLRALVVLGKVEQVTAGELAKSRSSTQ